VKNRLSAVLVIALTATTLAIPGLAAAQAPAAPATPATPAAQAPPATPASPDKRINGKWHFVFDTTGGDREFNAEFTVDADGNVTGTWEKAPATGTFKDGHLLMTFEITSEEANETAPLHLDGKIDDSNTITGTWQFSSYDGTFKANHPKP
jgi:hypothetical protein